MDLNDLINNPIVDILDDDGDTNMANDSNVKILIRPSPDQICTVHVAEEDSCE